MIRQVWFLTLDCRTSDRAQIINRFGCSPDAHSQQCLCSMWGSTGIAPPRAPHCRHPGTRACTHLYTLSHIQTAASNLAEVVSSLKELLITLHPQVSCTHSPNQSWIPDIAGSMVVCSALPKDQGTDRSPQL